MPIYEYKCENCPDVSFQTFAKEPPEPSPSCPAHATRLTRRYSFSTAKMTIDGNGAYDPAMGQWFDSETARSEFMKRKSDERSAVTGIAHDYASVHPADMADVAGVTPESTPSSTIVSRTDQREAVTVWL